MASPAAVIRVKRKITDDPVEALVLSFKRRRDDATSDNDRRASEVFKFTGTMPAVDDHGNDTSVADTTEQLKSILSRGKVSVSDRIVRAGNRRLHKLHVADIKLKSKQEKEEAVRQQRENLFVSVRAIDVRELVPGEDKLDNAPKEKSYDTSILPDSFVENNESSERPPSPSTSAISCNDQPLLRVRPDQKDSEMDGAVSDDATYVFDYYFPSKFCDDTEVENEASDFSATTGQRKRTSTTSTDGSVSDVTEYFNNLIDVYPYNLCEEAVDNGAAEAIFRVNIDEDSDDDEDSNAESNWRNDYPDEDDDFEKRYDFYDQTYESGEEETGEMDGIHFDGGSMIDNLRGMRLGAVKDDDEDDDQAKHTGYSDTDEYDPDD